MQRTSSKPNPRTTKLSHLRLKNFQRHGQLDIKLSPTITTIVGPSDIGKTAIVRALRWLCFNRPSGDAFLKHGEKTVSVGLRIGDHTIVRSKGKSNIYKLNGTTLKAFGSAGVPQDVAAMLNMDEAINFQQQLDPVFWLADSPGDVAKKLNAIVNLEIIDEVLGRASKGLQAAQYEARLVQGQRDEALAQLEKVSFFPAFEGDFLRIQRISKEINDKGARSLALNTLLETVKEHVKTRDRLSNRRLDGKSLLDLGRRFLGISRSRGRLVSVLGDIQQETENICHANNKLQELQGRLQKVKVCPTCQRPLKSKGLPKD